MPLWTLRKGDDLRMTWRPLNGYFWPYRINEEAVVQRQVGPDEWQTLSCFLKRDKFYPCGRLHVRMKTKEGKFKNILVKNLMIDAFMGGRKPNMLITFRNGMASDCALVNLMYTTPEDVGRRHGGGMRRSVEKIDKQGRVIELYASVSEAARKNFMSTKAIQGRCQNKVKEPFALNGYSFRYEKTRGVDRTIDFVHREN